jgi:hypothetical protein
MDALKPSGKPFDISKWEVWEAYRQVRAASSQTSSPNQRSLPHWMGGCARVKHTRGQAIGRRQTRALFWDRRMVIGPPRR